MMNTQALLLVAEDDADDQYFLQEAIRVVCPDEVEMRFVLDGAQLLNVLRQTPHDPSRRTLIVLDLNMRVKDGRATLRELKTSPAFADIPVVILTTSNHDEDVKYCQQYGAAAYYPKPSSIVDLVKIVRLLCREYLSLVPDPSH